MAHKYRINIEGEEHVVDVVEHGDKDYLITLDGKTYEAHIEDARGPGGAVAQPSVIISSTTARSSAGRNSESVLPSQKSIGEDAPGAIQISAPLTGTVGSVKVVPGAIVERGQLLCLLEAMKMEIEVVASQNGVVTTVAAKPSATVRQGDLLFVLHVDGNQ